jgi:hypothetical protein
MANNLSKVKQSVCQEKTILALINLLIRKNSCKKNFNIPLKYYSKNPMKEKFNNLFK